MTEPNYLLVVSFVKNNQKSKNENRGDCEENQVPIRNLVKQFVNDFQVNQLYFDPKRFKNEQNENSQSC